jgi:hypothetical protein
VVIRDNIMGGRKEEFNIGFEGSQILRMASSVMLRRVALVRTDISEEFSAFFIQVTRKRR